MRSVEFLSHTSHSAPEFQIISAKYKIRRTEQKIPYSTFRIPH